MEEKDQTEEPSKDAKHIDHDTSDAVLDLMQEFHIEGDELKGTDPKKAEPAPETDTESPAV